MRLLLIRHAITPETGSVLTGRLPGVALSERGHQMAREVAAQFSHVKVGALYTSPILRCTQTAVAFAGVWNLTPVQEDGLTEADYGRWAGRRLAALRKLKAWNGLFVAPSRFRFPDGESIGEVQARAVATIERISAGHRGQTVAVVSHADVIRATLAHYLGTPLDLFQRLDVAPASISVIDLPTGGFPRVPVINHFDPGRLT